MRFFREVATEDSVYWSETKTRLPEVYLYMRENPNSDVIIQYHTEDGIIGHNTQNTSTTVIRVRVDSDQGSVVEERTISIKNLIDIRPNYYNAAQWKTLQGIVVTVINRYM